MAHRFCSADTYYHPEVCQAFIEVFQFYQTMQNTSVIPANVSRLQVLRETVINRVNNSYFQIIFHSDRRELDNHIV